MHIEPGALAAAKIVAANVAAIGALGTHVRSLLRPPVTLARTLLAAVFFSLFMQLYHAPVGPSELHFVGASAVYFVFGFAPTLYGFALGLLLQGLLFEPQDLVHLGVNSLSLMVPLIATHALVGRRHFAEDAAERLDWRSVLSFDAIYYSGVVAMVGFWLSIGETATPVADWARFALSYTVIVACEPVFTLVVLRLLKRFEHAAPVRRLTALSELSLA